MTNVCIVKLINGDELVGRLLGEDRKQIIIQNPLVVEESFDVDSGSSNILLTSYIPFSKSDQSIKLSKIHVIQVLPVQNEVERYYENSLVYNRKYVTSNVEEKLRKVNENMESMMNNLANPVQKTKHKQLSKLVH